MTVTRGSRSRPYWRFAASAMGVAGILSISAFAVRAQPAGADEEAALEEEEDETESPIQPADTPTVGVTGNPSPVVMPPPPPPGPNGVGPALIPDGEAPPGPVAPAFPPILPNIDYAGRLRVGFHTVDNPSKFDDIAGDLSVDIYFTGAIHRMVKWQVGVTGAYSGAPGSSNTPMTPGSPALPGTQLGANAQILDVIARFEFLPEFNLYAGRMIVVADRYTPSGPWGMDEWYYPGILPGSPGGGAFMRSGPVGRDLGVNMWGALLGGTIKYYLGAYQFSDPSLSPLLSGRLQVSLLTPEPGFYQRTTYYGYKDLISFGVGAQYQQNGSFTVVPPVPPVDPAMPAGMPTFAYDDYNYLTGDLVIDKKLGDAGTISLVGSYAKFGGEPRTWDSHFLGSIGYLIPGVVGIGKIRPSVRFQGFMPPGSTVLSYVIDAQIGYVIMPWFVRVAVGYRHSSTDLGKGAGPAKADQIFLGLTLADP